MYQDCLFSTSLPELILSFHFDNNHSNQITGRNVNNLRYVDDTTLMAESKEELKSLLMKVKEESEKASVKLNFQKMKKN